MIAPSIQPTTLISGTLTNLNGHNKVSSVAVDLLVTYAKQRNIFIDKGPGLWILKPARVQINEDPRGEEDVLNQVILHSPKGIVVSIATVVSPNGGKPNNSTSNSLGPGDVKAHLTTQQKPNGGKSKRPNSNYIGPVGMAAHLSNFQPAPPPATKTQPACVQAHPSSSATKSPQWKSLFDEKNIIRDLHFIQPQEPSSFNTRRVKLGEDDHRDVSSLENSLVGFFIGKRPKKEMVEEALNRAWRKDVGFHFP